MKIPTVLTLKFPQVQIAFIWYLNIEIPRFLSLSALSGVLYGLWLTQSISVKLSFLIAWLVIRCGRLADDLIMQDKCLVKTKIGLKPYFNMQLN